MGASAKADLVTKPAALARRCSSWELQCRTILLIKKSLEQYLHRRVAKNKCFVYFAKNHGHEFCTYVLSKLVETMVLAYRDVSARNACIRQTFWRMVTIRLLSVRTDQSESSFIQQKNHFRSFNPEKSNRIH
jgi:hypothetical protein